MQDTQSAFETDSAAEVGREPSSGCAACCAQRKSARQLVRPFTLHTLTLILPSPDSPSELQAAQPHALPRCSSRLHALTVSAAVSGCLPMFYNILCHD